MRPLPALALVALSLSAGGLTTGCTQIRSHQGYVVDADLVNSVQPGVDNRESVARVLGQPSFSSQFGAGNWYYLSRNSKNYAFTKPHATDQLVMEISFDGRGTVAAVRRSGLDQVTSISPYGKTTPTLGRTRGFFADLFGNIGTVGAAGVGSNPDTSNTGGGRTRP